MEHPARYSQKMWLLSAGIPFITALIIGIAIGAYEVNKDSGKTLSATGKEETFSQATVDCLQTGFFLAIPTALIGIVSRGVVLLMRKKELSSA